MDRDTTTKRGSQEALIRRWERGDLDILVGTQMITKGHDVAGVTLVGALLADLSLNLPDFRAAERTFQLLSQVGGRSGRGDDPGRVIIQTYAPDHYALEFLVAHDYKGFFAAESEFRRALSYPPYGRLVNLRLDGPKMSEVEQRARDWPRGCASCRARHGKISRPDRSARSRAGTHRKTAQPVSLAAIAQRQAKRGVARLCPPRARAAATGSQPAPPH